MRIAYVNFVLFLVLASGCQQAHVSNAVKPTTLDGFGEAFVSAIASADKQMLDSLYISRVEFAATFSGEDSDGTYIQLKNVFDTSCESLIKKLGAVQFVRMNLKFCPEPVTVGPGQKFGSASFKVKTQATDNTRVIVLDEGIEREIKLDSLVMVNNEWRLVSPNPSITNN